jgi:hypothetical protein
MGHFVQYHPLTITSNGCETQSLMLREEHRLKAFWEQGTEENI